MNVRRPILRAWPILLAVFCLNAGNALAQRDLRDLPSTDPQVELDSFEVAEGFEVNLFAADPAIAKPIQMNFDAAGRLWIATSEVYPQIKPGQKANDKIVVLEDTDGDGRSDKTSVFADGLLIPTGVVPGDGGAYVANSTELIHLRDTDGDGRADRRRVVLSGFGTEDTHHIIHTFRWGRGGELCFNQSGYIHSHVETPHGVRRLNASGVWKLRTETLELSIFSRGMANPWGHVEDAWGQTFATDGAYKDGINYSFPNAALFLADGVERIIPGLNDSTPKLCGLEIVSGRHFPDDWQGNFISCDFRGMRVCRFVITEDRSGFASREEKPLIRTRHSAFRPVDVSMGPDGALYIADWYNPIIQHGEVDFRDPRRDKTHGRIWRVTAKGRPLIPRPKLVGASVEELMDALRSPEGYTRDRARRLIQERGESAIKTVDKWTRRLDKKSDRFIRDSLEALWVYQGLRTPRPDLVRMLLTCSDHRARAAATRVISEWRGSVSDSNVLLAKQAADEHPRVRLEAVCALGFSTNPEAIVAALSILDKPMDPNLDFALWMTARLTASHWLPPLREEKLSLGDVRKLEFALRAVNTPDIVRPLATAITKGEIPPEREESVLELIAKLGSPGEMGLVFSLGVIDKAASAERQTRLLSALLDATKARGVAPEGNLEALAHLLAARDARLSAKAAEAIGAWRVETLRERLAREVDVSETPSVRRAALNGLAALGGEKSLATFRQMLASPISFARRMEVIAAMAVVDLDAAAQQSARLLAAASGAEDVSPVVNAFLERKKGPEKLASELDGMKIPADVAKLAARAARATGLRDSELVAAIERAGGLAEPKRSYTEEEMKALIEEIVTKGDARRGEVLFHRADLACTRCHAIGGAGGVLGPDLLSVGAAAPIDYLVESLIDPSKKIKENYHSVVIADDSGKVTTGVKVRDTGKEIILRDAEDREVRIPKSSIEAESVGGSMMPVGLVDNLTRAELVDLTRFVSQLGKIGPYGLINRGAVRTWRVLQANDETREVISYTGFPGFLANFDKWPWANAYSYMNGELPLSHLPAIVSADGSKKVGLARFEINLREKGKLKLGFPAPENLIVALGTQFLQAQKEMEIELPAGTQSIVIVCDLAKRQAPIRCQMTPIEGSPARPELVGGK